MPWTSRSQWKAWSRISFVLFIGKSLEGARRLFCRGPHGGTSSLGHALTACFLLLYMVTVGPLYVTAAAIHVVWTKCPRHVAARQVMQTASYILLRTIQQCMHLILQAFLWWQLAQAQGNKRHPAGMVERMEGDSSGEYLDACEGSEDEAVNDVSRSTGGSSSRVTEERVTFDRLGQRVHEPDTPPPGRRLCPPPPQPLSAVREVSHAVAIAVGRALGMEGRAEPGLWGSMSRVAIHLTTFSPTDWSHPHLEIGDDPSPTMALDTTGSPTPPAPDAAPATDAPSLTTATTTTSTATGGLAEEEDPPPMAGMLPESREARRARWSRLSEEAVADEMLDMELGALVSSLEEPMDEATLNEVAADMLLNPVPDPEMAPSGSTSSGSTTAPATGSAHGSGTPSRVNRKCAPYSQCSLEEALVYIPCSHGSTIGAVCSGEDTMKGHRLHCLQILLVHWGLDHHLTALMICTWHWNALPLHTFWCTAPSYLSFGPAVLDRGRRAQRALLTAPAPMVQNSGCEADQTADTSFTCTLSCISWLARYCCSSLLYTRWVALLWIQFAAETIQHTICDRFGAIFLHTGQWSSLLRWFCCAPALSGPRLRFHTNPTPLSTLTMVSRVGPKSHGCGCLSSKLCFSMLFWLCFLNMLTHGYAAAADARVAPTVHQGAGASGLFWGEANGHTAHQTTVRPTVSPGLPNHSTPHQNRVRKRAFARAIRRASEATDHSTVYRGRRCVLQGHRFQVQGARRRQHHVHPGIQTRRSAQARLRTITINLGGLDAVTFDTFMAWLPTAPYDIVCLQEVHFGLGKESNSWVSAGWRFVTTIDASTRYQGVAILVRETLCRTGEMHYQEIIPGRLLHVRVAQEHHSLDLIGVYQHAPHLEAGNNNLPQRHKLWEKLGSLLHNLPQRNLLIMLGDYNCTPEYVAGAMGHCYEKASNYPDANEFAALLETHDLVLLNGWIRLKLQHTFTGARHQSTIDFVISRRHHADGPARKARTLPALNFSPWRMGGRHLAVGATLPLHPGWTSTSRRHPPAQVKYDKLQLDHEARHGGDRIDALRANMQAYLQHHTSVTLEQVNDHMLSQVSRLFPRRSMAPAQRAWNNPQVRGSVTAMWQARARLRNIWSTTYTRLRYSMEAFKRHRIFMQAYRLLKQNGRQARRTLLTNELAAAAEAAQRNDSGQLHRIIRRLAPKSKRVQVRIHGPNGEMLRDAAEHEAIVDYFEDLFQSKRPSLPIHPGTDTAPQVTEKDVYDSLCLTKYGKAVPPHAAPSSAVKCCADILAQAITPTVNACLQGATTPQRWANCHLALIPKPHKIAKRPANLRPLGLQDCNAKAYARLLKNLLLRDVHTALASMPVFAYIPSRGTDDAIARVSDHCRRVRNSHQQQVSNVHTYRAKKPKLGAYGGLQLAIDLTTAFDTVPRDELGRAELWAGANNSLIATILDLHSVCQYTVQHKGRSKCIHMRRGVRQGCTLAQLLYVIFSAYLISKLQACLPADWVQHHSTLYADDSHASFEVSSTDDIIRSFHIIQSIFAVYREHGMCVNPLKSGVVLGVRGLKATALLHKHLQGKRDEQCLVIGFGKGELRIPVKTSMTYLGICVSYGNFEQETLSARLKVAQATRCRLSKVLSAHRYLTQQQRIHLYVLCVRSAALYGLGAVGMTVSCLRKLQIFEVKHVRAIVRSPVHLTRETTAHLYKRLKLRMPAQQLFDVLRKRASRLRQDDLHKQWIRERSGWMQELLLLQTAGLEPVPVVQEIACPTCGQYFPTLQAMRQHHTRIHKIRVQFKAQGPAGRLHALRTQDHSVNHMPICKHCKAKLTSWHNFRVHILTSCPVLHALGAQSISVGSAEQSAAGPTEEPNLRSALQFAAGPEAPEALDSAATPVAERSEVLALLPQQNWKNILWLDGVKEHLRNHCILCAQWVSSAPGALNKHLFSLHPAMPRHSAEASAQSLTLREGQQRPCGACGARPLHRTKHKCRVLYQICLLRQSHLQALDSRQSGSSPTLVCPSKWTLQRTRL